MKDVREAFERARTDPAGIDAALAVVEAFLVANGDHVVAEAYQGSLHGMKAGAATLPWVKLRHANVAAALLDAAYQRRFDATAQWDAAWPGTLEILMLRGVAYASFPSFLGRGEAARASLEEAVRHPAFADIPATYRALARVHLAALGGEREDSAPCAAADLRT
jgi:hypothetical protein